MDDPIFTDPSEMRQINEALISGDAQQAFALFAEYLTRNKITLSDELFRLYLERELFTCLKGRGNIFDNM